MEFLKDIPESDVLNIFRYSLYDNSEDDSIKKFEKDELILFILRDSGNKQRLLLIREYKLNEEVPRLMIPLVNESYENISYRDFPYKLMLSSEIKELLGLSENDDIGINIITKSNDFIRLFMTVLYI